MAVTRAKITATVFLLALVAVGVAVWQFLGARALRADLSAQTVHVKELEAKRIALQERLDAAQQRVAAAARDRTSVRTVVQESIARLDARASAGSDPAITNDVVQSRYAHAKELVKSAQFEAALQEFLWCFDVGMKQVPGLSVMRLVAIAEMGELGKRYPEALAALRERRDHVAPRVLASESDFDAASEFAALNRTLGDSDRNIELYDRLPAGDRRRRTLASGAFDALVGSQRYAAALEGRPYSGMSSLFEVQIQERPQTVALPNADAIRQRTRENVRKSAATNIEVLAGAGDLDHARSMVERLLAYDNSDETRAVLQTHLERAGHTELLGTVSKP
jgi:hypothetical protein